MRTLGAVAALLLLAACGGGGGGSEPPSVEDVAKDVGCTSFKQDTEGQALTREIGSCELDGETIYVHTFEDSDQQSQWLDVAGAGGGVFVKGDLWVVQTFDADQAKEIAEAADGEVVN